MYSLYSLLVGAMLGLSLVFYFFGIRPLAEYLYDSHQEGITHNLTRTAMSFNYIVQGHQQLASQTASRTAIRDKQIAYLKHQITREELVTFSQAKLADAMHASDGVLGIARYDPSGDFLFSVGGYVPQSTIQTCLAKEQSGDIEVFPLEIDSKAQTLTYCSKIIDHDTGIVGFDVLLMNDREIRDFINKQRDTVTSYVLASAKGGILYWPDSLDETIIRAALKIDTSQQSSEGSFIVDQSDTAISALRLYSLVDKAMFRAPVNNRLVKLSLVLAFLSVGILIASIIVARPVVRSLLEEQEMRELSRRDLLTGLYNRRALIELSEREISRSRRYGHCLAIVMFDIDHFKQINDGDGHIAGDEILRQVGNYCLGVSRQNDSWIRYGGDEFLGLLPETDQQSVTAYAERLRAGIEKMNIQTDKGPLPITISGGYCSFTTPDYPIVVDEIIKAVDRGLYEAKKAGRNKMIPSAIPVLDQRPGLVDKICTI